MVCLVCYIDTLWLIVEAKVRLPSRGGGAGLARACAGRGHLRPPRRPQGRHSSLQDHQSHQAQDHRQDQQSASTCDAACTNSLNSERAHDEDVDLRAMRAIQDNIQLYLKACSELGIPKQSLFNISDLYDRKDLSAVRIEALPSSLSQASPLI